MRSFVPAKLGSESLVLLAEFLMFLFKLLDMLFEREKFRTRNLNAIM